MSITFTDNLNAMAALSTTTTVAPSRAAICGDSAVLASENTDSALPGKRISFTDTRARRSDPQTSRDAAKVAASNKASQERIAIRQALEKFRPGLTAREIAAATEIDYIETQRRLSEVAGIEKTTERRDGCMVWRAVDEGDYFQVQGALAAERLARA